MGTFHEYGMAHPLRQAFILALKSLVHHAFTPDPALAKKSRSVQLIYSGSNIPVIPILPEERARLRAGMGIGGETVVGFFGMTLSKGFHRFQRLVHHLGSNWKAVAVGGVGRGPATEGSIYFTGYYPSLVRTSHYLQTVDVFFLPYPDGLSGRRGSFWAVVDHGVPVVTFEGEHTERRLAFPGVYLLAPDANDQTIRSALQRAITGPRPRIPDFATPECMVKLFLRSYVC